MQVNGRVLSELPAYIVSDPGVKIWDRASQTWQIYNATVNSDQPGNISLGTGYTGAFWGPEAEFAYRYRQATGREIYIVKASVAGAGLYPGSSSPDWNAASTGQILDLSTVQVNAAKAGLTAVGKTFKVKAIVWGQGETDSTNSTYANAYASNLSALETKVRAQWGDAGTAFIIARVNDNSLFPLTYRGPVRLAQMAEAAATPSLDRYVDTDSYGLDPSNNIHYDAAATAQLGRDFLTAYQRLTGALAVPTWVPKLDDSSPALVHMDFVNGRYWANGSVLSDFSTLLSGGSSLAAGGLRTVVGLSFIGPALAALARQAGSVLVQCKSDAAAAQGMRIIGSPSGDTPLFANSNTQIAWYRAAGGVVFYASFGSGSFSAGAKVAASWGRAFGGIVANAGSPTGNANPKPAVTSAYLGNDGGASLFVGTFSAVTIFGRQVETSAEYGTLTS